MKVRFDRSSLDFLPLCRRENRFRLEDVIVDPDGLEPDLTEAAREDAAKVAAEVRDAVERGSEVILAFGAHVIRNGLVRVVKRLIGNGFVTHLATNGAGFIHDWEFAYQGSTCEDVGRYVGEGRFGMWEETGANVNLAIAVGAYRGLGYGEAVGSMIAKDGMSIPGTHELTDSILAGASVDADRATLDRAGAAADLMAVLDGLRIPAGPLQIEHPFKEDSLAAAAWKQDVRFTAHPMYGHDVTYAHPACTGAAIGRAADRDFLAFVDTVSRLEGGVYLSIGSAVMSPMIFEKALSMARNAARAEGRSICDFSIHVVDLAGADPAWADDEPASTDPAYYLRFCKTFNRMGGHVSFAAADNRSYLTALLGELESGGGSLKP